MNRTLDVTDDNEADHAGLLNSEEHDEPSPAATAVTNSDLTPPPPPPPPVGLPVVRQPAANRPRLDVDEIERKEHNMRMRIYRLKLSTYKLKLQVWKKRAEKEFESN